MCRIVPRTARAFSSPRSSVIPVPTRINPIWDMEEQASVRFRSMENTARNAPPNMVITPRQRISFPHCSSYRKISADTTSTPKTPVFVRIPDSSALAGAGATGCALGSHTCSGNIPALAPKPNSMQSPARKICCSFSCPALLTAP